jgi:hypothetical protein
MAAADVPRRIEEMSFDERQDYLGSLTEEARGTLFRSLPRELVDSWVEEEKAHLENLVKDQPTEGADFGAAEEREIKIDGADEPQDREPDADPGVIAQLVKEKVQLTIELNEARADVERYYSLFGPLPPSQAL